MLKDICKKMWLPLPLNFIRWKIIDLYRRIKYGQKVHLYGIRAFVGLYGGGKTMGMSYYLRSMRKKYGDSIYIATNYFYSDEDFKIDSWKDLLPEYDKPVIFAYDELQNEFNSREYKGFPASLMTLLTQNRKGNGKQIIYTCQDFETVDKNFRRLTKDVGVCHTILSRFTTVKFYDTEDYNNLISTPEVNKRMKIRKKYKLSFVQDDDIRNCYDSFQMLESAKSKDYIEQINKVVNISE